jgi:hypothetical protein
VRTLKKIKSQKLNRHIQLHMKLLKTSQLTLCLNRFNVRTDQTQSDHLTKAITGSKKADLQKIIWNK